MLAIRPPRLPSKSVAAGTRRTARLSLLRSVIEMVARWPGLHGRSWPHLGQRVRVARRRSRRRGALEPAALCRLGQMAARLSTRSCTWRSTGLLASDCPVRSRADRASSREHASRHLLVEDRRRLRHDRRRLLADDVRLRPLTAGFDGAAPAGAGRGSSESGDSDLGAGERDQPPQKSTRLVESLAGARRARLRAPSTGGRR